MNLPVRLLGVASIAFFLSSPAGAAEPTVIVDSIDVRVVNVEVVATDAKGQRVRGLPSSDLRLLVDDKEVPIEFFTEVTDGRTVEGQSQAQGGPVAPLPPAEAVGRCFLVFVDDSFSIASQRDAVLAKLDEDLKRMGPEDRMAVLAFDGKKIDVLSPWTADIAALAQVYETARRRPAQGDLKLAQHRSLEHDVSSADEVAELQELTGKERAFLVGWLEARVSPEARSQLGRTVPAIAAALRAFQAPPGRKVMLLVSGGWSFQVAPRLLGEILQAANHLGYSVYPVDAASPTPETTRFLDAVAGLTGGKAVNATLRQGAFELIVEDSGSYYWLGFTPAWKGDDRGHSVKVEAKRPGVTLRARSSFSDLSRRVENALQAESVLLFGGSPDRSKLLIELGAAQPAGRKMVEVPVTLGVPVESLVLSPTDDGGYAAEIPLAIVASDEKGGRSSLPTARLRVVLREVPSGSGYARFRTTVKLRRVPQKLIFTVQDVGKGGALWGEVVFKP
jgi:VWFA-related protein